MIRQSLKRSQALLGVARSIRRTWRAKVLGASVVRRKIVNRYLASNQIRKLQLGTGSTSLAGWLSSDIDGRPGQLYLDATKPFPFADGVFDYIYSEHMIEHISWHDGLCMLRECKRVLRPGGTIRIATPDLRVLVGLYNGDPMSERYVHWITDRSAILRQMPSYKTGFVINNAFRDWGHQFVYDGEVLEMTLSEAGFVNITRCSYGESTHASLRGIESHGKNISADEMAVFETMIFEATAP